MSQITTNHITSQTANAALAMQIVTALQESNFIEAGDTHLASALLTTGTAKAGDWRRLLEKNLAPTTIATDHAATHHTT